MTATAAVGCPIDTVNASSAVRLSAPNVFAAAICSTIACTEIFTAGTAMRSLSVKSRSVFTAGLRVTSG